MTAARGLARVPGNLGRCLELKQCPAHVVMTTLPPTASLGARGRKSKVGAVGGTRDGVTAILWVEASWILPALGTHIVETMLLRVRKKVRLVRANQP